MEYPQNPASQTEEVHLYDYLNVLYRRRRTVAFVFFAVLLGVILFTFLQKPVYEATATLHVRDEKVRGGILEDLGLSRENPIDTEIEILKSRTNAEEVVRRLHFNWQVDKKNGSPSFRVLEFTSSAEEPEYRIVLTGRDTFEVRDGGGRLIGRGRSGARLQGGSMTLLLDELAGEKGERFLLTLLPFNGIVSNLRQMISASEVGKQTNIIRLAYRDTDPARAKEVVNTLAEVYVERSVLLKTEEARKTVEFIEQQLKDVRTQLDDAEQSLEAYKRESGVVKLDSEAESLIERITRTEMELARASLRRQQLQIAIDALSRATARGESYAPAVFQDDPVVASLAEKLAQLEVEKRGLLVELSEAHPEVRTLQNRILEVQRKILDTYRGVFQDLQEQEKILTRHMHRYESQLKELPEAERELARLTRRATVNADIYIFLLQKHEEARIARAAAISNINVIDPAITPENPVKPRKKVNLLLGLLVGGMLGIGLAFFQEYLDDTIKDAETAKRVLGLPLLVVIPFIHLKTEENGSGEAKRTLVTRHEPKSAPTEAFRSLRTAIHFSAVEKEKKVLLVTSAFPGEGKTTVAANLAVVTAQTGSRVLLVGCDLRKPTLHSLFGRPRFPGLTELLVGDADVDQAIHATNGNDLDFISAGATPPNPAELLGSVRMRELIAQLRGRYDTILLDAPPLLAVTDASLLTSLSDLVLIVLEAGGVPIKAAQRMAEVLRSVNAPVAGLVFNDRTGKGMEYHRYYRDSYSGKYGYRYGYYASEYHQENAPEHKRRSWLTRIFKK